MHVLTVLPWYKPQVGGVVHGVSQLVKRLPSRGVRVTILLQQPYSVPTLVGQDGESEIYAFNTRIPDVEGHQFKSLPAFLWYLLPTVLRLRQFMRERQIDLVNVHYPSGQYLYFGLLKKWFGYPLVVSMHGSDIRFQYDTGGLNELAYKNLLKMSSAITAVCEDVLDQARRRVTLDRQILVPIFGGADPEFLAAYHEPVSINPHPYILCVARLHPVKGHDTLLKAFRIFKEKDQTGCRLILAGSGELESDVRSQIAQLELSDVVRVLGNVEREDLARLNRSALFAVLASRSEGLPLSILEAFAAGKTAVATDVGGTREVVVDGVTGFLAPADDPTAFAAKMTYLVEHPEKRAAMERNAHVRVEQDFTWDRNADGFVELFTRLLAKAH